MSLLASAVQLLLPWWELSGRCFRGGVWVGCVRQVAFWAGFGGAALSWLIPAAWLSHQNEGLLAGRMATLLPLGGSAAALVLAAGVVAGLVGGLSALAGFYGQRAAK